ncbi:hypothetical protein BGZ65_010324, partial [Modicella reniformis]
MSAKNARPIKKIIEVKARKKYEAAQKLVKIQKRTDAINEIGYLGEREVDRYKVVDPRMKKELRATKRIVKNAKGSNCK